MSTASLGEVGFCGKLPNRADFVTRRLPLAYVEPWHDWLAAMLAATRDALGPDWLDAYLYGPIWRFALPAGVAGPAAMAGTLMPSVDSVGRYFPLTVALALPSPQALAGVVSRGRSWFAGAEALSLAALEEEIGLDALSERLAELALPPAEARKAEARSAAAASPGLALSFDPEKEIGEGPLALEAPAQLAAGSTLWWTLGSEQVPPVLLIAAGLPTPRSFAALLTGRWAEFGWRTENLLAAPVAKPDTVPGDKSFA